MTRKKLATLFKAVHEAGHALFSWYFGFILRYVSIIPGTLSDSTPFGGICEYHLDQSFSDFHNALFSEQIVFKLMAGRAATDVFFPNHAPGNGHKKDFADIVKLKSQSDLFIKMHQWKVNNPGADVEIFYNEFKEPLLKILKSRPGRRAVKNLSEQLLIHGKLSGREAAGILETSWGKPLPPHARPAEEHQTFALTTRPKTYNDLLNHIAILVKMARADVMDFYDQDENTKSQNREIERINNLLLEIQVKTTPTSGIKH